MNKSELMQKKRGTLLRNRDIQIFYQSGLKQVVVAKLYGLSRQRIHQIIHRYDERPQYGLWRGLWRKLIHKLSIKN